MKIEMGESLVCSWLKHIKDCQIVQSNWRPSKTWDPLHSMELERLVSRLNDFSREKHGDVLFSDRGSLLTLLQETECDVLGIKVNGRNEEFFAVEVAFHGAGLNYGRKKSTAAIVAEKCARIAMCLYAYFDVRSANIMFVTPKAQPKVYSETTAYLDDLNAVVRDTGYMFSFSLLAGDEFVNGVLKPVLQIQDNIADTNELFVRGAQLTLMGEEPKAENSSRDGLPVGKIAQLVLRPMLESGRVTKAEIEKLQDRDYSKRTFALGMPMLVPVDGEYERNRYYVDPVKVGDKSYMLCSQWFEKSRSLMNDWIKRNGG